MVQSEEQLDEALNQCRVEIPRMEKDFQAWAERLKHNVRAQDQDDRSSTKSVETFSRGFIQNFRGGRLWYLIYRRAVEIMLLMMHSYNY